MSRDAWRTTAVAALGAALIALSWPLHRLTELVDPPAPYVSVELAMAVGITLYELSKKPVIQNT